MSEYTELIKNIDRIRKYMHEFYIYGFKVRNDFTNKSLRTYDNEKRRIESYLGDYVKQNYCEKGKQVNISIDTKHVFKNPLYCVWKAKSFTNNDIMLHFFISDLLCEQDSLNVNEFTEYILINYGVLIDTQVIRIKLKEYEENGLIKASVEKKTVYYKICEQLKIEKEPYQKKLLDALKLFQEIAPFGFIASTILDCKKCENNLFIMKHYYIIHTLYDDILLLLLEAIQNRKLIKFDNLSLKSKNTTVQTGLPVKIFESTKTGRRYVCIYKIHERQFINMRIDCISNVNIISDYKQSHKIQKEFDNSVKKCYGVSFGEKGKKLESIYIKLRIDTDREPYILDRLYREGKDGEVIKIDQSTYLYSVTYYDMNEILPWVKSFTGRIIDIQGTNKKVIEKVQNDLDAMYQLYFESNGD